MMTKNGNTQNAKFAEFFKSVLNDRRLSKAELSRISKVSEATLSRIESGSQQPSLSTLKKLALALNLSMDEVMINAGYPITFTVNCDTNRIIGAPMVLSSDEIELVEKHRKVEKQIVDPKNSSEQHRNLEVEQLATELQTNPEYLELHRLMKNMPKKAAKEVLSFARYKDLEGKDRGPDDDDDF